LRKSGDLEEGVGGYVVRVREEKIGEGRRWRGLNEVVKEWVSLR